MAINKNHEFEDLEGIKCAVVEKNVSTERIAFLENILKYNRFKTVVIPSPPPKAIPPKPNAAVGEEIAEMPASPVPETFTLGVTDVSFNATNAIFGRLLKMPNDKVVTLAYWNQKEEEPHDEVPYYEYS